MTRENMFTKIVAWLICAVMIIGMIPNVSLPAAATENDWEGDIDVVETEPPAGSESNPIDITNALTTEDQIVYTYTTDALTEETFYLAWMNGVYDFTVSGEGDFTVYFNGGSYAAVDGSVTESITCNRFAGSFNFSIDGTGVYEVSFALPAGTIDNPELTTYGGYLTLEEGSQGHYYKYIAEDDGIVTVSVYAVDADGNELGWQYSVQNLTAYQYGEIHRSNDDVIVNPEIIEVSKDDEIVVFANTFDPDSYDAPAGNLGVDIIFSYPEGTENNPIWVNEPHNVLTNAGTVYYGTRANGTTMVITGGDYVVYYGDDTFVPDEDGKVSLEVVCDMFNPFMFQIAADGEITIDFVYPVGTMENPAVAVLGDNAASIAAGAGEYYWNYTAEKDGELNISIIADGGWFYTVNNITAGTYGDGQWSDSDPVVNPTSITVAANDVIEIQVAPYDPAGMPWDPNPAGDITVNLAYTPEGPAVAEDLKFMTGWSLSFQDYIGMSNMVINSGNYEKLYIVATQVAPDGTTTSETIEGELAFANYYAFVKEVLAWSMSETVTLQLYGEKEGVVYAGQTSTASIESLALGMLAKYHNDGIALNCQVLVDMLNYGAAVQTAYDHYADSLPNTQISDYAHYATAEVPTMEAVNSTEGTGTLSIMNAGISMQDKVLLTAMVSIASMEGYEIRCTSAGSSMTVSADGIVPIPAMPAYGIASFPVKAADMRTNFEIAIYDVETGEIVSPVRHVSVEAFAKTNMGGTYESVAVALMKYGDSVYEYANK